MVWCIKLNLTELSDYLNCYVDQRLYSFYDYWDEDNNDLLNFEFDDLYYNNILRITKNRLDKVYIPSAFTLNNINLVLFSAQNNLVFNYLDKYFRDIDRYNYFETIKYLNNKISNIPHKFLYSFELKDDFVKWLYDNKDNYDFTDNWEVDDNNHLK